jgi:hypothetical protein
MLQIFCLPPLPQLVGDVITAAEASPIYIEATAAEQKHCPERSVCSAAHPSPSRRSMPGWRHIHRRFSTRGTGKNPNILFFHLHNIAHPQRLASLQLVSSRYVWLGLAKDVAA